MKWSKGHRSSVWLFHSSHKGLHPFFTKGTYKLHKASQWFSNDLSVIDPFKLARCLGILIVWPEPLMQGGMTQLVKSRRVSHDVGMKMNRHKWKKLHFGCGRTQCAHFCDFLLHTSVLAKPCLRKMQAGPTMLCSMLQFFTSAPRDSLNGLSSTSKSSSPSSCWLIALTLRWKRQCITRFGSRSGC